MDDLPDGTSANPLAPPKKGRRSATKNVSFVTAEALMLTLPKHCVGAPPPYTAPSGDLIPLVSVIAQYLSWLLIFFPQTSENGWQLASAPVFHQCPAESDRFGFSATPQHIVPLGTEPDLQALNNPYIAATRRDASSRPNVQCSIERWWSVQGRSSLKRREKESCRGTSVCWQATIY